MSKRQKMTLKCKKCNKIFTKARNLRRHLKENPENCKKIQDSIKHSIKDTSKKIEEDYEQRLTIIQENNKKVVDALIHAPAGVKNRQRVIENVNAQENKIRNYETVVASTEIPEETLRKTVELMAEGDIILFRRIFIDHVKPELRCIRVKDFARDKFEFFDGKTWVTTTFTWLVEHFAQELHKKYKFLIFEKAQKVKDIDMMYYKDTQLKQNMRAINELCWEYANITEHVTKLGINDPDFINEIKRGIKGLLVNTSVDGSEKKAESEPFKFNENYQEPIEPLTPEYSSSDEDEKKEDDQMIDQIILPSLFKVLGIKFDVNNNF
jgi:phage FluMu protein Com